MNKLMTLMAAVAMLALSASPLYAKPVNCNTPMGDLQGAIDDADPGDTIIVQGVCEDGPYFINKDLKLFGPANLSAAARIWSKSAAAIAPLSCPGTG